MSEWLELELAQGLAPVSAPDDLWERIQEGRPVERHFAARWPIAAMLTVGVAAATLWLVAHGQEPVIDLARLAGEQINVPAALELRSSDSAEIGKWISRQTGISVTLPARTAAQFSGARMITRSGVRIAAVNYTIDGEAATLLVTRTGAPADSAHGRLSWSAGGLSYALACSNREHPEIACLLCHTRSGA
jgi:anti-sigma factor RsiW